MIKYNKLNYKIKMEIKIVRCLLCTRKLVISQIELVVVECCKRQLGICKCRFGCKTGPVLDRIFPIMRYMYTSLG